MFSHSQRGPGNLRVRSDGSGIVLNVRRRIGIHAHALQEHLSIWFKALAGPVPYIVHLHESGQLSGWSLQVNVTNGGPPFQVALRFRIVD